MKGLKSLYIFQKNAIIVQRNTRENHNSIKKRNMLRPCFILFLTLTMLISCSREDFSSEWEDEIIVPPSEELETGDLNGYIKSRTGLEIAQADLILISSDTIVAETLSDNSGYFEFYNLIVGHEYLLQVRKEDYVAAIRNIEYDGDEDVTMGMILDNGPHSLNNPLIPFDENVVVISGSLVDLTGTSVSSVLYYSWNQDDGPYAVYTEDGFFSFLAPRNATIELSYLDECLGFEVELLLFGPFSEDFDLGELPVFTNISGDLSGFIQNCTGEMIQEAVIYYTTPLDSGFQQDTLWVEDGAFVFFTEPCSGAYPIINELIVNDIHYLPGEFDSYISYYNGEEYINIQLCDSIGISEITGNVSLSLDGGPNLDFDLLEVSSYWGETIDVFCDRINEFMNLSIEASAYEDNFHKAKFSFIEPSGLSTIIHNDVIFESELLETHGSGLYSRIKGTFYGDVIDVNGYVHEVSGALDITISN